MVRKEFEPKRFTSKQDEWGTPLDKFRIWDNEFDFTLDPCGDRNWILKTPSQGMITYYPPEDGLKHDWDNERVFVNPPYGEIKKWVQKCYAERNKAELIVLLIFARTDTSYFHEFIYKVAELRFIRGRLKFHNLNNHNFKQQSATFPSMLCIFRNNGYPLGCKPNRL